MQVISHKLNLVDAFWVFGSLNHFGQNALHLVPTQKKKERKNEEENYISEMGYLNRLRLKQDSLVIERKETN